MDKETKQQKFKLSQGKKRKKKKRMHSKGFEISDESSLGREEVEGHCILFLTIFEGMQYN